MSLHMKKGRGHRGPFDIGNAADQLLASRIFSAACLS